MLGDDVGGLHSFAADERDKRERAAAPVYAFEGRACAPITGLQQHALAGGRTLVLVATATRLHAFAGGPTLEALFSAYPESSGMPTSTCLCWQTLAGVHVIKPHRMLWKGRSEKLSLARGELAVHQHGRLRQKARAFANMPVICLQT